MGDCSAYIQSDFDILGLTRSKNRRLAESH